MNADQLFEVYKSDMKMKKFTPILEGHAKYPVFYDQTRSVLSLPPIINSEKTKITLGTKNVFIEITGTDIMKTRICLAILASQFSTYCKGEWKHRIEQCKIVYEGHPEKTEISPSLDFNNFEVELNKINSVLGVKLDIAKITACAEKMGLQIQGSSENGETIKVSVPPTRADILHPCDVIEDIGIGYGFNNIERVYPNTNTVGSFQPNNKFADMLRAEMAQAGYNECLTFSLLSYKDNYTNMRLAIDHDECVQLSNPKTIEFQVVRTSLVPGLLQCLRSNKGESLPQKIFEVQDCAVLDASTDTGARNVRKLAACVLDLTSNFEVVHGLLDQLMMKVGATFGKHYRLVEDKDDPRFLPTRGFAVMLQDKKVGSVGVLHPEVLGNFELKYPVQTIELEFDALFSHFKSIQ